MKASAVLPAPGRLPRRAAALLEQGLVSGANFCAFVLFARVLTPEVWGSFALAYATVLFLQGFQRALVTLPMLPFSARSGAWADERAGWAGANSALGLGAVACLLLAAGLAAVLGAAWVLHAMGMAAMMTLPLMAHEFTRRAAIQEHRFDLLVGMGGAYALVLCAAALWPAAPALEVWMPALGVGLGAAAAAGVYGWVTGHRALPRPTRPPPHAHYRRYTGWALLSHLGYSGYNFGVQAILAGLAGPAAVGAFHACRMLVQPVSTLMTAMDSIDKPRAAATLVAQGPAAMRWVLLRLLGMVSLLALPYLAAVAFSAGTLLELVYGERYAEQQPVVLMWCLVTLCALLSQPVESGLYVAERTQAVFMARLLAALVSLGAALVWVPLQGAAGALAAMALGYALAALLGFVSLRRLSVKP
jgi:O-antigen/teichoic acid export membrane protein